MVTDPELIVADEPTGDLDRKSANEVLTLMEILRARARQDHHHGHARPEGRVPRQRILHLEKGQLVHDTALVVQMEYASSK